MGIRFQNLFSIVIFLLAVKNAVAQPFAPPADNPGSTAISSENPIFKSWAKEVVSISRGFQNILVPELGQASAGEPEMALGPPLENGVVSLGDGGSIVLKFEPPIRNGEGFDFAVFENGFSDDFLELGHVSVSSDGIHFYTFPSVSLTDTTLQVSAFGALDARNIYNLAGKYRTGFGTPFDLDEIKNQTHLDPENVGFIKITDVVGSINPLVGTRARKGSLINDPFPTPYPSCGFDLDAIGVIHQRSDLSQISGFEIGASLLFSGENCQIRAIEDFEYQLCNPEGKEMLSGSGVGGSSTIQISAQQGIYFVKLKSNRFSKTIRLCIL